MLLKAHALDYRLRCLLLLVTLDHKNYDLNGAARTDEVRDYGLQLASTGWPSCWSSSYWRMPMIGRMQGRSCSDGGIDGDCL